MKTVRFRQIQRMLREKTVTEKRNPDSYEKCVACGKTTDVPAGMPINERKCYVPGGGQLCRKCCIELYGTDDLRSLQSAELGQMFLG